MKLGGPPLAAKPGRRSIGQRLEPKSWAATGLHPSPIHPSQPAGTTTGVAAGIEPATPSSPFVPSPAHREAAQVNAASMTVADHEEPRAPGRDGRQMARSIHNLPAPLLASFRPGIPPRVNGGLEAIAKRCERERALLTRGGVAEDPRCRAGRSMGRRPHPYQGSAPGPVSPGSHLRPARTMYRWRPLRGCYVVSSRLCEASGALGDGGRPVSGPLAAGLRSSATGQYRIRCCCSWSGTSCDERLGPSTSHRTGSPVAGITGWSSCPAR